MNTFELCKHTELFCKIESWNENDLGMFTEVVLSGQTDTYLIDFIYSYCDLTEVRGDYIKNVSGQGIKTKRHLSRNEKKENILRVYDTLDLQKNEIQKQA